MTSCICPLEEASALGPGLVGGKAAALGTLIKIGMPVPPGFVIHANGTATSSTWREEVLAAFERLGAEHVAVRSSATCEDGKAMSWAGELETFLNVPRELLLDRIQACVDSLDSPRAKTYRALHDLDQSAIGVAVVVQAMIPAEQAGVVFTMHPVTGNREHVVVEAGPGLGEAVVGGEIIPDTYVLEKGTARIVDGPEGIPLLTGVELAQLLELCQRIENHFAFPCDIEWAKVGEQFFILQARPITTTYGKS
ncbi:MAG: PEP/pyruvate-binding domain-containing protein [Patescibacteria group bacterium]